MVVKFKIPHISTDIRWVLDWKIPYFPKVNDKILISCFLPDDLKANLSKLHLADWLELVEDGMTYEIPNDFLSTYKITEKELSEEDKKKVNIKELFLDIPCIIHDIVWLRGDSGELQAYLEIYLNFEEILSSI